MDKKLPRATVAAAMSADVRTESHVESEESGFFHHLDKPIDPAALEAVLDPAAWMLESLARDQAVLSEEQPQITPASFRAARV